MVYLRSRLAVFIKERRGSMPQREFARRVGVAQSTIMRIENHDQNVTLDTLEQLCRAFHVDVGELFPVSRVRPDYRVGRAETRAGAVHEPSAPATRRRRKPRV
ncbi:MAG: helix-turn-helix transcriptional regulator [Pseudohongiellaceae bacterium]